MNLFPNGTQHLSRFPTATPRQTMGNRNGIKGTRTGSAYAGNGDFFIKEQLIQNAPCEGAMGTAALQRQIQPFRLL